jgi:hypothetical protein
MCKSLAEIEYAIKIYFKHMCDNITCCFSSRIFNVNIINPKIIYNKTKTFIRTFTT